MTPEERRKRVEHVAKLAELGVLAEPAYDREEWRAEEQQGERPSLKSPKAKSPKSRDGVPSPKSARRRTA
jgi:hypothetical protein